VFAYAGSFVLFFQIDHENHIQTQFHNNGRPAIYRTFQMPRRRPFISHSTSHLFVMDGKQHIPSKETNAPSPVHSYSPAPLGAKDVPVRSHITSPTRLPLKVAADQGDAAAKTITSFVVMMIKMLELI
jgi:hypothetical protein